MPRSGCSASDGVNPNLKKGIKKRYLSGPKSVINFFWSFQNFPKNKASLSKLICFQQRQA